MHPILSDKKKLIVYLGAWLIIALLVSMLFAVPGELGWPAAFVFALPLTLIYSFVCLSAWYLCRTFPLRGTDGTRLLFVFLFSSAVSSSLWVLLGAGWSFLLSEIELFSSLASRPAAENRLLFGVGVFLYLLTVAVHYLIIAFEESREVERRALELKLLAQSAELRALRAQINPHFLFNSLNSISALTTHDPTAARSMAVSLAEYFRKSLHFGPQEMVTLEEEIGLVTNYLAIEQIRFGPRLKLELEVDPESGSCLVPPLILQPLIENAIKHGIAPLIEGGVIGLKARRNGTRLYVHIQNPCDPDRNRHRGTGVGLDNVRNRLKTQYEAVARLDTTESDRLYRVDLTIPIAS